MSEWGLALFAVAGFISSIMSGIAGGGAAFITTPLAIFLGLTPGQAVATGKFSGLSVTIGSLSGMRKAHGKVSKARVIPVMVLALAVGLVVPFIIKSLDSDVYRIALGIILLLMIPVVIFKKVGVKPHHPQLWQKWVGGALLTVSLLLQGIFSGGLGTLVNIVLMGILGMTAIEANLTKRWSALILNATIIAGVVGSGLVLWHVAAVGICSTFAGSFIGGRLAVRKGDVFIMRVMIVLMFVSALALIFGA
ncbi:MAG: rane protein of unknown function [Candidatus Saccharibacteria bacterium]|nr:rane protein of unknown function [Candidatus Saccharibacteria bacterium]